MQRKKPRIQEAKNLCDGFPLTLATDTDNWQLILATDTGNRSTFSFACDSMGPKLSGQ
jgi:hypothetical protein